MASDTLGIADYDSFKANFGDKTFELVHLAQLLKARSNAVPDDKVPNREGNSSPGTSSASPHHRIRKLASELSADEIHSPRLRELILGSDADAKRRPYAKHVSDSSPRDQLAEVIVTHDCVMALADDEIVQDPQSEEQCIAAPENSSQTAQDCAEVNGMPMSPPGTPSRWSHEQAVSQSPREVPWRTPARQAQARQVRPVSPPSLSLRRLQLESDAPFSVGDLQPALVDGVPIARRLWK